MPTYRFRCEPCGGFEDVLTMAEVPASTPCPHRAGAPPPRITRNPLHAKLPRP